MYLNKALIIGNLTRDPELRSLPSGIQVCSFSLATNRVWKNQEGSRQEATEYHNVVVFGRQAETSAQYLKKGDTALVEGRLQTRSWDSEGVKKYRTEIIAERVQFGSKGGGASRGAGGPQQAGDSPRKEDKEEIAYPDEDINPEDIPF